MKQKTKWMIHVSLLTLILLAALTGGAWGSDAPCSAVVVYQEAADAEALTEQLARMENVDLLWDYSAFFSGAAVKADAGTLRTLEQLDGVASVERASVYAASSTGTRSSNAITSEAGLSLMGMESLWDQGFTGDGTVIAIIDSGLNTSHEAFADASLTKNPALSKADIDAFIQKGGTAGQYISTRIPFAYDYFSNDGDVSTTNQHGTHVTALAAGYALDKDGKTRFRGAAPGAQILSMKIFPDGSGSGTDDTIILRAMEDAWNLGADVINISVGVLPGFSASDDMDGLYCRAFRMISESGTAIFCAAGNSKATVTYNDWTQPLPTGGYTDYSSVLSPASIYGATATAAATLERGRVKMAEYSSWGPASGLHLCPSLTVFGGPVMAASATGTNTYRSEEGTSMASPVASGVCASLLQSLRQRGITDKRQSCAIALGLLESTASLLTDSASGLPLSPRWQGAGYVDLAAAAESDLVVMDPLIELGDSDSGSFTLTMTLRNLSGKAVTVSLSPTVLTDSTQNRDGAAYSLMTPRDITGSVKITGGSPVTVPANGEVKATLQLDVSEQLRQELASVCPNGFYVEGYVTASGGSRPVHSTFLGYCGDWGAAPVLEPSDFRDVQDAEYRLAGGKSGITRNPSLVKKADYLKELGANLGANVAFLAQDQSARPESGVLLGANSRIYAPHDDARNVIPAKNGETAANGVLCMHLYSQRNAAGIVMLVSNPETKEIYYASDKRLVEKSIRLSSSDGITPSAGFAWEAVSAAKSPLPDGTQVRVDVYAWLDSDRDVEAAYGQNVRTSAPSSYAWLLEEPYQSYRELSFPVTVDGKAPTVSASLTGSVLTLTLRDEHCVAYAAAQNTAGAVLAEQCYTPAAGENCTLTVDFTGKTLPSTIYVQVEDYATHSAAYEVDLKALAAGEAVTPKRSSVTGLADVKPAAWYREAVNYVLVEGVMEVNEQNAFRPDAPAVRSEIVTALYRANGSPASKYSGGDLPFPDLSSRTKNIDALCWAYENQVVSGRADGSFDGSAGVTRQELAVMLYRCASLSGKPEAGGQLSAFPDASRVASWAAEAMSWAVGQGLIKGNSAGQLSPSAGVTRAETAQILMRFMTEN